MLRYGFFDSIDGDRTYGADDMSQYFKGLISNGVFESVGDGLVVTAAGSMAVNVGTGRGVIDCKWASNDGPELLQIAPASAEFSRITNVVLRLDVIERKMELDTVDGVASSSPVAPLPVRGAGVYELVLAQIEVPANASAIYQQYITDTRADLDLCGWVTGLIEQVDTTELFLQWQDAYERQFETFKQAYDQWFEDLTQDLNVDTYIQQYRLDGYLEDYNTTGVLPLSEIPGYTYNSADVVLFYINGLLAIEGSDYWAYEPEYLTLYKTYNPSDRFTLIVLKSRIGFTS